MCIHHAPLPLHCPLVTPQASLIAEEVIREKADSVRVLFNKFHSAISFKPTMATVLSAEVCGNSLVEGLRFRVECIKSWPG